MQHYTVILSEPAEAEIQEAYLWLMGASPDFAGRWYDGLSDAIAALEFMPRRCMVAPENDDFPDAEVRVSLYRQGRSSYRILFTIMEPDVVRVLHIRPSARYKGNSVSED